MASRRAENIGNAREQDANRSLTSWRTLDVATLRLKCNSYDLSETGRKEDLIKNLMDYFESLEDTESSSSDSDSDGDNPTPPPGSPHPTANDENIGEQHGDDYVDIAYEYDMEDLEGIRPDDNQDGGNSPNHDTREDPPPAETNSNDTRDQVDIQQGQDHYNSC